MFSPVKVKYFSRAVDKKTRGCTDHVVSVLNGALGMGGTQSVISLHVLQTGLRMNRRTQEKRLKKTRRNVIKRRNSSRRKRTRKKSVRPGKNLK